MKTKFKLNIVALLAMFLSVALLVACTETDNDDGGVLALAEADTSNYSYSGETLVNKVGADLSVDVTAATGYGNAVLKVNGVDTTKHYSITRLITEDGATALNAAIASGYGTYTQGMDDTSDTDNSIAIGTAYELAVEAQSIFTESHSVGSSTYACTGAPGTGLDASLTCNLTLNEFDTVETLEDVEVKLALVTFSKGTDDEGNEVTASDAADNAHAAIITAFDSNDVAVKAREAAVAAADDAAADDAAQNVINDAILEALNGLTAPEGTKEFTLTLSAVPFEAGTKADTEK